MIMGNDRLSLYAIGWRQGSVLAASLPYYGMALGTDGSVDTRKSVNDNWVVVTQDCTLARTESSVNKPSIELRQVISDDPPTSWGITSRKFLMDKDRGHYLVDDKPSIFVSPRLLAKFFEGSNLIYTLPPQRILALKTWLGNRYDRPAVPDYLVDLARSIALAVKESRSPAIEYVVREVLMTFEPYASGIRYKMIAVVENDADKTAIKEWMVNASLSVPSELGVPDGFEALRSSEISLQLVENSYCADVSQLTWDDQDGPEGAF
jgi:hypothetical protein